MDKNNPDRPNMLAWKRPKLPMVYQTQWSECLLASVAMIANFYGRNTQLATLRHKHRLPAGGASFADLRPICADLNLQFRAVRVTVDQLSRISLPAILHWSRKHFVVLKAIRRGRYFVHDPASGAHVYSRDELAQFYSGVAAEFQMAVDAPAALQAAQQRFFILSKFATPALSDSTKMAVANVTSAGALLAAPVLIQKMIDGITAGNTTLSLLPLASIYLLLVLFAALTHYILQVHSAACVAKHSVRGQVEAVRHLLALPIDQTQKTSLSAFIGMMHAVQSYAISRCGEKPQLFGDALVAFLALCLMATVLPSAALLTAGFNAGLVVFTIAALPLLGQKQAERQRSQTKLDVAMSTMLRNFSSLKQSEMKRYFSGRIDASIHSTEEARLEEACASAKLTSLLRAIRGVELLAVFIAVGTSIESGVVTLGGAYAVIVFRGIASQRFDDVSARVLKELAATRTKAMLNELEHSRPEAVDYSPDLDSSHVQWLTLDQVSLRYGVRAPVLDGCTLHLCPGKLHILRGKSGAGKTTLLRVMAGRLAPSGGQIKLGCNTRTYHDLGALRAACAALLPDDDLLPGTIAQNVSLFSELLDHNRVEAACKTALIHDEIVAMPLGYETEIGESAPPISSGQRQRVLLARALYMQRPILILDEPTATLNRSLEIGIFRNLASINSIVVVASHAEVDGLEYHEIAIDKGVVTHRPSAFVSGEGQK